MTTSTDLGGLKRDLRDMLMVERSKMAKRVVLDVERQRKAAR